MATSSTARQSESELNPPTSAAHRRSRRPGLGLRALLTAPAVVAIGCSSVAPSAVLPTIMASRQDKKIASQAQLDAFPSPQDVGLEPATKP